MPKNPHSPEYIRRDASFFTDMSNDKDMLQFTNRKKVGDGMFYNAEGAGDSTAKLVETEEPREADHPLTLVEESNQDKYAGILALEKQALGGFLARPSAGKMGRAALLGLGLGGAGALTTGAGLAAQAGQGQIGHTEDYLDLGGDTSIPHSELTEPQAAAMEAIEAATARSGGDDGDIPGTPESDWFRSRYGYDK